MGGIIGMACNELARFSETYATIVGMEKPEGTSYMQIMGGSIAKAWNDIADRLLDSDAEWLMLLNDDHVYPPNTLTRLLSHDVDMVTGYYLKRTFPFSPVLYNGLREIEGKEWYETYYPQEGESGLQPIVGCGDGCVLIKRKVLEAIEHPIWEISKFKPDLQSTDLIFCEKVRKAGFKMFVDLDLMIGHMLVAPVFPDRKKTGQWQTLIMQRDGIAMAFPPAQKPPDEAEKGE